MKISDQTADDLEFMAWAEENVGLAGMCRESFTLRELGTVLKSPSGGGAYGDDAISRLSRGVYRLGGGWRKCVMLGVKADIFQIFRADWLESS